MIKILKFYFSPKLEMLNRIYNLWNSLKLYITLQSFPSSTSQLQRHLSDLFSIMRTKLDEIVGSGTLQERSALKIQG